LSAALLPTSALGMPALEQSPPAAISIQAPPGTCVPNGGCPPGIGIGLVGVASQATKPVVHQRPTHRFVAPKLWKNCTTVNKRYPHGVGKAGARDHMSSTPVTNFRHSTRLYNLAMKYNRGLDRDKDGIACEKR
jgi:hypothetical protein